MTRTPPPLTRRRESIQSADDLVQIQAPPGAAKTAIPIISCRGRGLDLCAWIGAHRPQLTAMRLRHGGILLRGFDIDGATGLHELTLALGEQPMPYTERSSPRTRVAPNVYTSTEYSASQTILPHCENSYATHWPLHIAFYCRVPATFGGETPVADCRRVLTSLDPALVAEFRRRGVRYVRNYHPELGLSWQEVYGVQTRSEVEECCRRARYGYEWTSDDVLRTWRTAPAVVLHPVSREPIWFNHCAFFHACSLPAGISEGLRQRYAPESLPNHVFFGDGGAIAPELIASILAAYRANSLTVPWQAEDVMLLDNMLMSHGRTPYVGARSVLVVLTDRVDASVADGW